MLPVTRTAPAPAIAIVRAATWTCTPLSFRSNSSHSPMLHARADLDPEVSNLVGDGTRAPDRGRRRVEPRKDAITGCVELVASELTQCLADDPVVTGEQLPPAAVTHFLRCLRRPDDVGEHQRCQDARAGGLRHSESVTSGPAPGNRRRRSSRGRGTSAVGAGAAFLGRG